MSTPYEEIYSVFRINKIKDLDMNNFTNEEIIEIDFSFLKSARSKFKCCKKVFDYDDTLEEFTQDLTEEEIGILASLMIVEWLTPKINSAEFYRMNMDSKDFRIFSPANQLKTMSEIRDKFRKEANSAMGSYSYNDLIKKI